MDMQDLVARPGLSWDIPPVEPDLIFPFLRGFCYSFSVGILASQSASTKTKALLVSSTASQIIFNQLRSNNLTGMELVAFIGGGVYGSVTCGAVLTAWEGFLHSHFHRINAKYR